jgi:hypothetical protein
MMLGINGNSGRRRRATGDLSDAIGGTLTDVGNDQIKQQVSQLVIYVYLIEENILVAERIAKRYCQGCGDYKCDIGISKFYSKKTFVSSKRLMRLLYN